MSFKHITFLFIAAVSLFFVSCKKEDIKSDHKITSFHATLGGASWEADTSRSEINEDDDEIIIWGMSSDYTVQMTLTGTGKGNFDLDDTDNDLMVKTATKEYHYLQGTNGKVTLTLNDKVDHALSGEFSGMLVDTLLDTLLVEAGEFTHIKYLDTTNTGSGPGTGTGICGTNMIAASVDGNSMGLAFTAATKIATAIQIAGGNSATGQSLQVVFPQTITPGTYSMDVTDYIATYSKTVGTTSTSYSSVSGTLVITEHDQTKQEVKGTFSFTGKEVVGTVTKEITAGSFCVKYN